MAGRERWGTLLERTCIVTRKKYPPQDMIRFVVGPGQAVVPDIWRKLPGRGVWVMARADIIAKAVQRDAFSRSFKTNAAASANLPAEVEALLIKDCLQQLALANKAGQVLAGFAKVEEAIGKAALSGLIHARDASVEGVRKLEKKLYRRYGGQPVRQINLFSSAELDLALGRINVIHAALLGHPASEAFIERCRRLALLRSAPAAERPSAVGPHGTLECLEPSGTH